MKTLEEYIRQELTEGKVDFKFRAFDGSHGIEIYIHPDSKDGATTPLLLVKGNFVRPKPC